jgi:hypothetical protein
MRVVESWLPGKFCLSSSYLDTDLCNMWEVYMEVSIIYLRPRRLMFRRRNAWENGHGARSV